MRVDGTRRRTIWLEADGRTVGIIDQTSLPFGFRTARLTRLDEAEEAIRTMRVRGAPLIGVTAAYGMALAMAESASDWSVDLAYGRLLASRPTAVNLRWALDRMREVLDITPPAERMARAYAEAAAMAEEDVATCEAIGRHGLRLVKDMQALHPDRPLNILTHCNAGWLATVDWGTATSPIYQAHRQGIPVHVWVDETRPRNQGAFLTAWELGQEGVPHTVIPDNTGGHLMQRGMVDLCIVGTDRVTAEGDVANKIGTYLKALAAKDTGVPFWVALPGSTIDWTLEDGVRDIPIEQRGGEEVSDLTGQTWDGRVETVRVVSPGSPVANYAFDVTPARLVSGFITERGLCEATREGLSGLFPDQDDRSRPRNAANDA